MFTKEEVNSRDRSKGKQKKDVINLNSLDTKKFKIIKGNKIHAEIQEEITSANFYNKEYNFIQGNQPNHVTKLITKNFQLYNSPKHERKLSDTDNRILRRSISPLKNENFPPEKSYSPSREKSNMTKYTKFTLSDSYKFPNLNEYSNNNDIYNSKKNKLTFNKTNGGISNINLNNFFNNDQKQQDGNLLPIVNSNNIKIVKKNKANERDHLNLKLKQFEQYNNKLNEGSQTIYINVNPASHRIKNNQNYFDSISNKREIQESQNVNFKDSERKLTPNNSRKFLLMRDHSEKNISNPKLKIIKNLSPININSREAMTITRDKVEDENIIKKSPIISKYASKSKPGVTTNGYSKTNQDSYLIKPKIFNLENYSVFGVFDGHGIHGHFVSNTIKLFFEDYFSRAEMFKSAKENFLNSTKMSNKFNFGKTNLKEESIYEKLINNNYYLIKNSYFLAESALVQSKYEVNFSGATCVIVILIGDKLICANAGDSRAILVVESKESDEGKIIPMSRDHKPELKDETQRIVKSGGRVDRHSDNGLKMGPFRVWLKNENFPGLAMSRSVGDFVAESVGVICEPEIFEFNIRDNKCKFIIIASDGVWEFLSNQKITEIVNFYYKNNDAHGAAERIVDEAVKRWKNEDNVVDDITVIVLFFNNNL